MEGIYLEHQKVKGTSGVQLPSEPPLLVSTIVETDGRLSAIGIQVTLRQINISIGTCKVMIPAPASAILANALRIKPKLLPQLHWDY